MTVTEDEFRAVVREAFQGSAEDAVSGGYGFDYDNPVEDEFPDHDAFETFLMEGGPGDDIRRAVGIKGVWPAWMHLVLGDEARAEYRKLCDLWPSRE